MLGCTRFAKEFTSKRSAQKIKSEVGNLVGNLAPSAEGSVFEYCSECRAGLLYDRGD